MGVSLLWSLGAGGERRVVNQPRVDPRARVGRPLLAHTLPHTQQLTVGGLAQKVTREIRRGAPSKRETRTRENRPCQPDTRAQRGDTGTHT